MGRDDEGKKKKIGEAGGYFFLLKIGIIIIFHLSRKRREGTLFFFSNPFLPRGFFFPFSGTILNDKKVVPKGDRGPKGNT